MYEILIYADYGNLLDKNTFYLNRKREFDIVGTEYYLAILHM